MNTFKSLMYIALATSITMMGCKGAKETVIEAEPMEERVLEGIVVSPEPEQAEVPNELPTYNPSYIRKNDILHTKLDLSFDWSKQHVLGEAWIDVKPLFYDAEELVLDAKGFDLAKVQVDGKDAKYDYKDEVLTIQLGKKYTAKQQYQVYIDYTAKPNERTFGGSSAITSEKGLFFINPLNEEGDKPQQIWTQGETENNSAWFPTVDKPNERMTQEIHLTVRDEFETLSNGLLKSSKKNSDGTRTDHWLMDMPHAPYLAMLTIGDFAVVEEQWKGKLLQYFVEHDYKKDAKAIFSNTPEMLTFFSDYLGVEYPWQKYSQVVVRDYVSGAMENTTAVIFGDFVQNTERELIDNHNERIVAHELMHHWFGDLVTCESWANLTMNEGFANYSEYLWLEHKYGSDYANYHLMNEQEGYMASAMRSGMHPLIHFGYDDKEDMFDGHSYNKGGAILHMLRKTVGEKAFRASLEKYLNDNKFQAVEAHDLRLAFEEVTGQDLNWFFNQWFFNQGHPELNIEYGYDEARKEVVVNIEQTQDPKENPAIFTLPMAIDVYEIKEIPPVRYNVVMNQRKQEFRFETFKAPKLVVADGDHYLLANVTEERSEEASIFQYYNGNGLYNRYQALSTVAKSNSAAAQKMKAAALKDKFWAIRNEALGMVNPVDNDLMETVAIMAEEDPRSDVRASALLLIAESGNSKYVSNVKKTIDSEQAYNVIAAGLEAITSLDATTALKYAEKFESEENGSIIASVGKIYESQKMVSKMPYFAKNLNKTNGYGAINFFKSYAMLSMEGGNKSMLEAIDTMSKTALDMSQSPWRRLAAADAINNLYLEFKTAKDLDNVRKIKELIGKIKDSETNNQLKNMYEEYGK